MPADALALALGAAALHALWNLLLARESDTEAATAVAVASLVGVLAVAAGVMLVRGGLRGSIGGLGVGAVIAAAIAGYTVVDRYGIHHANAAPYLMLVMAGPALAYSLAIGPARVRRALSPATVVVGAA